jgi:imidazole glycerol-phosphate synthase subunit HisH
MIAIIDYKAGNITSVARALQSIGEPYFISDDITKLKEADHVIFPGVGAAGDAMSNLKSKDINGWLLEWIKEGKPLMGICLGTQIILDYSEENETKCVGIIHGTTKRFPENLSSNWGNLKIPHMGWNSVAFRRSHPVFTDVAANAQFYFVHSYYPAPSDNDVILGITDYGISFCSVLASNNLVAMQFHPEKSGRPGLQILKNFCKWRGNA